MNFLLKLPRTQRDKLIRKAVALEARETKPKTQAELLAEDLLRRMGKGGKTHRTGGSEVDYIG